MSSLYLLPHYIDLRGSQGDGLLKSVETTQPSILQSIKAHTALRPQVYEDLLKAGVVDPAKVGPNVGQMLGYRQGDILLMEEILHHPTCMKL